MSTVLYVAGVLLVIIGLFGNYTSIEGRDIGRSIVFDFVAITGCALSFLGGTLA